MSVDLELALGSIRVYASEHGLSGDQVRAMFSVGISVRNVLSGYGFEPFPMALNPSLQKTHIQDLANRSLDLRQIGGLCIN
jgi:hypothetical protein